jgi:hypothetical protein
MTLKRISDLILKQSNIDDAMASLLTTYSSKKLEEEFIKFILASDPNIVRRSKLVAGKDITINYDIDNNLVISANNSNSGSGIPFYERLAQWPTITDEWPDLFTEQDSEGLEFVEGRMRSFLNFISASNTPLFTAEDYLSFDWANRLGPIVTLEYMPRTKLFAIMDNPFIDKKNVISLYYDKEAQSEIVPLPQGIQDINHDYEFHSPLSISNYKELLSLNFGENYYNIRNFMKSSISQKMRENIKIRDSRSLLNNDEIYNVTYHNLLTPSLLIKPRFNNFNRYDINSLEVISKVDIQDILPAPLDFSYNLYPTDFMLISVDLNEDPYITGYCLKIEKIDEYVNYIRLPRDLNKKVILLNEIDIDNLNQYKLSVAIRNTYSDNTDGVNYEDLNYSSIKIPESINMTTDLLLENWTVSLPSSFSFTVNENDNILPGSNARAKFTQTANGYLGGDITYLLGTLSELQGIGNISLEFEINFFGQDYDNANTNCADGFGIINNKKIVQTPYYPSQININNMIIGMPYYKFRSQPTVYDANNWMRYKLNFNFNTTDHSLTRNEENCSFVTITGYSSTTYVTFPAGQFTGLGNVAVYQPENIVSGNIYMCFGSSNLGTGKTVLIRNITLI